MDSGRDLRNDQSDISLPRGRELNLDFTDPLFPAAPRMISRERRSGIYCLTPKWGIGADQ